MHKRASVLRYTYVACPVNTNLIWKLLIFIEKFVIELTSVKYNFIYPAQMGYRMCQYIAFADRYNGDI
jgi:hypothetical protein